MHEEGLRSELAQGTGAGSMHAASAHTVSTTTVSSHATGTTTSGNPMSAAIGASSTDSRQLHPADADRPMHAPPVAPVATAPNHWPPHAHVEGGQHDDYFAPPPMNIFVPPDSTALDPVDGTEGHTPAASQPDAQEAVATKASVSAEAPAALQTPSVHAPQQVRALPTLAQDGLCLNISHNMPGGELRSGIPTA